MSGGATVKLHVPALDVDHPGEPQDWPTRVPYGVAQAHPDRDARHDRRRERRWRQLLGLTDGGGFCGWTNFDAWAPVTLEAS